MSSAASPAPSPSVSTVTGYWRPMCGYCNTLKRRLSDRGVPFTKVDIWRQRDQAEAVRQATGGDDILPTVRVGERFLVNPSADEVVEALQAPEARGAD